MALACSGEGASRGAGASAFVGTYEAAAHQTSMSQTNFQMTRQP